MNTLIALILAASTALAAPPINPPTRVYDPCKQTFEMTCRIISEMRDRGEIDQEMWRHLIQWAYQEYLACRAVPARLPYSERRGD
jgi:hypothetical protein